MSLLSRFLCVTITFGSFSAWIASGLEQDPIIAPRSHRPQAALRGMRRSVPT